MRFKTVSTTLAGLVSSVLLGQLPPGMDLQALKQAAQTAQAAQGVADATPASVVRVPVPETPAADKAIEESEAQRLDREIREMKRREKGPRRFCEDLFQVRQRGTAATEGGIAALEEIVASGITVNVTLIFSERQYVAARDACWRGALRRMNRDTFKSVYSIFVSRLDVYTERDVPALSSASQGMVGIVNAKNLWQLNQRYWSDKALKLKQEIVFASTGTKKPNDPAWKYVEAFAGSDIETNPPKTNADVQKSGRMFKRMVDQPASKEVVEEISQKVDMAKLEDVLMREGLSKFADPQKALIALIAQKRG